MKSILGNILIVVGIIVGIYLGLWWAFIGGIVSVIEQIRAPHLDATTVALGIVRIIFASSLGTISAFFLVSAGIALTSKS